MAAVVYEVGDIVTLKKGHPCGSKEWEILRWWRKTQKIFKKRKNNALQPEKSMLESKIVIYKISLLFDRQRANRP